MNLIRANNPQNLPIVTLDSDYDTFRIWVDEEGLRIDIYEDEYNRHPRIHIWATEFPDVHDRDFEKCPSPADTCYRPIGFLASKS
jgi:hypothetical protein